METTHSKSLSLLLTCTIWIARAAVFATGLWLFGFLSAYSQRVFVVCLWIALGVQRLRMSLTATPSRKGDLILGLCMFGLAGLSAELAWRHLPASTERAILDGLSAVGILAGGLPIITGLFGLENWIRRRLNLDTPPLRITA